jgi:hypothetical protein
MTLSLNRVIDVYAFLARRHALAAVLLTDHRFQRTDLEPVLIASVTFCGPTPSPQQVLYLARRRTSCGRNRRGPSSVVLALLVGDRR